MWVVNPSINDNSQTLLKTPDTRCSHPCLPNLLARDTGAGSGPRPSRHPHLSSFTVSFLQAPARVRQVDERWGKNSEPHTALGDSVMILMSQGADVCDKLVALWASQLLNPSTAQFPWLTLPAVLAFSTSLDCY